MAKNLTTFGGESGAHIDLLSRRDGQGFSFAEGTRTQELLGQRRKPLLQHPVNS
jgi:hypothetical protein